MKPLNVIIMLGLILSGGTSMDSALFAQSAATGAETIALPKPELTGKTAVEEALAQRRSVRSYQDRPLDLQQLAQLLWSAQGITNERGFRTAPSAGATYPLEVYAVINQVADLQPGVYHYRPANHALQPGIKGSLIPRLSRAALNQGCVRTAPLVIVITAIYERTTAVYNQRGRRYVHMEAGHVSENIYLQAESLGLGTVAVGAFQDVQVQQVLHLADDEAPLYLMPVGQPQK